MANRSQSTVSGTNAAATITIAAVTGAICKLARLDAFTSAGTSTLTVEDGSATIWRSSSGEIGTTRVTVTWIKPLEGNPGNAMTITGTAAGAGNTVTISVEVEQIGA